MVYTSQSYLPVSTLFLDTNATVGQPTSNIPVPQPPYPYTPGIEAAYPVIAFAVLLRIVLNQPNQSDK